MDASAGRYASTGAGPAGAGCSGKPSGVRTPIPHRTPGAIMAQRKLKYNRFLLIVIIFARTSPVIDPANRYPLHDHSRLGCCVRTRRSINALP
jgi:hypothetical protein